MTIIMLIVYTITNNSFEKDTIITLDPLHIVHYVFNVNFSDYCRVIIVSAYCPKLSVILPV